MCKYFRESLESTFPDQQGEMQILGEEYVRLMLIAGPQIFQGSK